MMRAVGAQGSVQVKREFGRRALRQNTCWGQAIEKMKTCTKPKRCLMGFSDITICLKGPRDSLTNAGRSFHG